MLPPESWPLTFAAMAAVFVAQLVKGVTGFGSALVAVLLLSWIYSPAQAIFLSACVDILGGGLLLSTVWRELRWPMVLAVFVPVVIGQTAGTALLVRLPVDTLKVIVGATVGLLGLRWVLRPVRPGHGELAELPLQAGRLLAQGAGAGLLGGVMGGLMGASGPPVILFMKRHFQDRFVRAHLIGVFFLGSLTMMSLLLMRGAAGQAPVQRFVWVLPGLLAGAGLGSWLSDKMPRALLGRLVGGLLLAGGVGLVARVVV